MKKLTFLSLILVLAFIGCSENRPAENGDAAAADSLYYPVDSIDSNGNPIRVCTSEDGNLKFFVWNTGQGGTMPAYDAICLFRTSDGQTKKVNMGDIEEEVAWIDNVHTIKKDDGTIYYILIRNHRISSNDGYAWVDAYKIDGDSLKAVNAMDASEPIEDDSLEVNYSISDWYEANNGEESQLIWYDAKTQNLYVEESIGEDTPQVASDRFKVYHFNGTKFEPQGVQPHPGLHESLAEYKSLVSSFKTKSYIIRIDLMGDNSLRYASWKSKASISEKPDLVILGGQYDDDSDTYMFTNEGVEYIAGYSEDKSLGDGVSERHDYLLVRKDGKIILKEEKLEPAP